MRFLTCLTILVCISMVFSFNLNPFHKESPEKEIEMKEDDKSTVKKTVEQIISFFSKEKTDDDKKAEIKKKEEEEKKAEDKKKKEEEEKKKAEDKKKEEEKKKAEDKKKKEEEEKKKAEEKKKSEDKNKDEDKNKSDDKKKAEDKKKKEEEEKKKAEDKKKEDEKKKAEDKKKKEEEDKKKEEEKKKAEDKKKKEEEDKKAEEKKKKEEEKKKKEEKDDKKEKKEKKEDEDEDSESSFFKMFKFGSLWDLTKSKLHHDAEKSVEKAESKTKSKFDSAYNRGRKGVDKIMEKTGMVTLPKIEFNKTIKHIKTNDTSLIECAKSLSPALPSFMKFGTHAAAGHTHRAVHSLFNVLKHLEDISLKCAGREVKMSSGKVDKDKCSKDIAELSKGIHDLAHHPLNVISDAKGMGRIVDAVPRCLTHCTTAFEEAEL